MKHATVSNLYKYILQIKLAFNEVDGSRFEALNHDAYEKIIQWKRNMFMLPTGASGKKYINRVCLQSMDKKRTIWINSSKSRPCHASFITSKPSKSSKSKKHLEVLTRRLSLWNEGRIDELLYEGQTIQDRLKAPESITNISKISKNSKFQWEIEM